LSVPSLSVPKLSMPKLAVRRPQGFRAPSLPGVAPPALPAYAAVPLALAAVIGGLVLIQAQSASNGGSSDASALVAAANDASPHASAATPASPAPAASAAAVSTDAKLIRGSNFTVALPPAWKQTTPPSGATFAAASADGGADATLWVRDEPKLDFPTFEASALAQLRTLAGSAHVASRVAAPTADGTVVRLAADAPAGKPAYEVTLRVYGSYRYYLATTLQPGASPAAAKGVDLLSGSLTPVSAGGPPAPATTGGK
jgi:hypothetical protein